MSKTAADVKKGLECCSISYADCNSECPYKRDCDGSQILKDALALIQQLEREQPIWHILPYDMPPYTGSYIVCTASGKVCTAKWYEQRNDFAGIGRKHIVAWQWLPLGITVEGDNDEIC